MPNAEPGLVRVGAMGSRGTSAEISTMGSGDLNVAASAAAVGGGGSSNSVVLTGLHDTSSGLIKKKSSNGLSGSFVQHGGSTSLSGAFAQPMLVMTTLMSSMYDSMHETQLSSGYAIPTWDDETIMLILKVCI